MIYFNITKILLNLHIIDVLIYVCYDCIFINFKILMTMIKV